MYDIVDCSDEAFKLIEPARYPAARPFLDSDSAEKKYPFRRMNVGHSFAVPMSEGKYFALHVRASKMSKVLSRKFKVLTHSQWSVYEVVRIA